MVYCGTSANKNVCPDPVWKPVNCYYYRYVYHDIHSNNDDNDNNNNKY